MDDFFFEREAHQSEKELWTAPEVVTSAALVFVGMVVVAFVVAYIHAEEFFIGVIRWLKPLTNAPPKGDK